MKENINALDEISKGASMGMDAIHFIIDKIESSEFKDVVDKQYNDYKNISETINEIYNKYNSEDEPHETSVVNKVMTWYGVEMKTLMDKSDSKIAELLLQGTNMGIIEGRRILNNKKLDDEVKEIMSKYVTMQEECVDKLKDYL